jgi:hypothetical protein
MQVRSKSLSILLAVFIALVIVASVVIAKMPARREVVYLDTGDDYDPSLLALGVRASKFSGMPIYSDSPAALLGASAKLQLSESQKQRLQEIIDKARQDARASLTAPQVASLSPISEKPVILPEIDKTITACEDGSCAPGHDH